MATRYAGKYRRNPYPQARRLKTFTFLRYLSPGGDVLASPLGLIIFVFYWGDDYFYWGGDMSPHPPPYFAHWMVSWSPPTCDTLGVSHECKKEALHSFTGILWSKQIAFTKMDLQFFVG